MAHINPVFVIPSSELAIGSGQDRLSAKPMKGSRTRDLEEQPPPSKCKEFQNMFSSKWKWSCLFNGMIAITLFILIVALELGMVPFRPLGYQCKDPNLSYKYVADTINFSVLAVVTALLPLISVLSVEFFISINIQSIRSSWKMKILYQAVHWYIQFFLGILLLVLLVQLAKGIIGEPRPHFFQTCKPDKINCTGFITEFKCTNRNVSSRFRRDTFKSFPSGHAAMSCYTTAFLSWFVHRRIPNTDYLVSYALTCLFLTWALLCSLTRITDRQHHWWDVLAGGIMGIGFAVFAVKVLCKNFNIGTVAKPRKQDKNMREARSSFNNWYRKYVAKPNSDQHDDKELRELK